MLFVFSDSICFNFFAPLIICKSCVISDDEEGEDGEEGNLLQDLYNKTTFSITLIVTVYPKKTKCNKKRWNFTCIK